MRIYDYISRGVIEVSDDQYDFMQALLKNNGRFEDAKKDFPVTNEKIEEWRKDSLFWPCLEGWLVVLWKSRGLTVEYVKSYILDTLEGKAKPDETQMKALTNSIRALGMGLNPRTGINGKVQIAPESVILEFSDGIDDAPKPNKDKPGV